MVASTSRFVKTAGGLICGSQILPPTPTTWAVFHGDSLTYGSGATIGLGARVGQLIRANQPTVVTGDVNIGTPGISWTYHWFGWPYSTTTLVTEAAALVDVFLAQTQSKTLVAFAGTNGIYQGDALHTGAQEYANFLTYFNARTTAGWTAANIVVPTMLPRGGALESERVIYNSNLVSGAATYGYKLARLDLDPNIGQAGQNSNATYYADGVHLNDVGQLIAANIIYSVLYP